MHTIYRAGRREAQELGHYPNWRKPGLRWPTGVRPCGKDSTLLGRLVWLAVIQHRYNLNAKPFCGGTHARSDAPMDI
jgi:hypothetical protein